jgi:3-hydroxyisobutyrate dehydrogenase-like beta-hydroxyacid dehydrogenase
VDAVIARIVGSSENTAKIAFMGIGHGGRDITGQFAAAGHDVTVSNRASAK